MTFAIYKSALQLNEKEKDRCSYPLRLDVYGNGCEHDCTYCYARDAVKMGGWNNSRNSARANFGKTHSDNMQKGFTALNNYLSKK
jgi:DNA repair photolyase